MEQRSIADSFDAFFFDLDGVVYIGRNPTPRAPETLRELRSRGKRLRFLTNNPSVSREGVAILSRGWLPRIAKAIREARRWRRGVT